jgi:hypothetical protein
MPAKGQKQTSVQVGVMSALPPKADIAENDWHVRFVPKADIRRCSRDRRYSIISSARASKDGGTVRRYSADYIRDALWPRRPVTVPTPVPVAMRGSAPVQFRLSAMHR